MSRKRAVASHTKGDEDPHPCSRQVGTSLRSASRSPEYQGRGKKRANPSSAGFFGAESLECRILLSAGVPQIFVASGKAIGQYTASGASVNATVANTGTVASFAVAGDDVFYPTGSGSVGVYDYFSGATINSFISGVSGAVAVALSGSDLYVASSNGTIGQYTISGQVINSSLITGLSSAGTTQPLGLAVSGADIFVLTSQSETSGVALGAIAEYTTSGTAVNSSLVSNIPIKGGSITAFGPALFIANGSVVSEYTSSGMEVNGDLARGASFPSAVAIYGSDLFVATSSGVGEYTITGQAIDPNLITGLTQPTFLAVGGPAAPTAQLSIAQQETVVVVDEATAGALTVDVEDTNGNLVVTDSSTVTLSILLGPSGAVLGGTTTAQVVNGVATFDDLVFPDAGTYTLQAADGSLAAATTAPITAIVGWVDVANWGQIRGWVFDPSDPTASVSVEVTISGGPGPPQSFTADETRPDLESVVGSTNHGFDYSPPFLSVGSHAVSVFATVGGQGVLIGDATIVSQNSMFDEGYYLREYPAVAAAVNSGEFATGYDQFVEYGQYENGFNPSPYWDYWANQWYLEENPDVAAWATAHGVKSAFMQYYEYGQYENRGGLLYFNTSYYLSTYPSIATAIQNSRVTSPFEHFLLYGQYEGLSPMMYFSSAVCDADNPEINPMIIGVPVVTGEPLTSDYDWFIEFGQTEQHVIVSNYYNETIYLADNPDVATAVYAGEFPDGFVHWLEYGQYEGRTAV
jgi:hypothetical protein